MRTSLLDYQDTNFDPHYDRRWTGGHKICEFDHYDELAGSSGAHFHIWVPLEASYEQLIEAVEKIRRTRDLVSWSWSFVPTNSQ